MKIRSVIWCELFIEKLATKHQVEISEAEQALKNRHRVRRIKRGHVRGEDVYLAPGRTEDGRYLNVFFVYKKTQDAIIISARDMDENKRNEYEKS